MLSFPLPFIANTAGWMTAEIGRQPYLVYGLLRTADGFSKSVSAGNGWFTLLGFLGMYTLLRFSSCSWFSREIEHGPELCELPDATRKVEMNHGRHSGSALSPSCWPVTSFWMALTLAPAPFTFSPAAPIGAQADDPPIGPVWDGNEVWLLATGGVLYFVFPQLYASSFSGFYLPLMMVLWLLMLRAIGIEFRTHIEQRCLEAFFDGIFALASLLLAIFYGAALGNVVRGVPLGPDHYFFLPLLTNWRVGPQPGILDWYTVLSAWWRWWRWRATEPTTSP